MSFLLPHASGPVSSWELIAASVALDEGEWKEFTDEVVCMPVQHLLPTLEATLRTEILKADLDSVEDIERAVMRLGRLSFRWMGNKQCRLAEAFANLFSRWYGGYSSAGKYVPKASAFQLVLELARSSAPARAAAAPHFRRAAGELSDKQLSEYVLGVICHE